MELIKNVNFAKYLADISFLEAETIKQASSFQDAVDDYYDNGAGKSGMLLPWERTHDTIQLADGELSIWAGVNGHGKSVLVGQVVMWAMKTERVLIASLEMKPHQTIIRMAAQAAGCTPSRDFVGEFLAWTDERLWIYDQLDTVAADKILGMTHYAAVELGIKHIVIDSLTKCGLSRDDYAAQAKFVDRLQWAAKRYNVHIHLVCHMRKGMEGQKSGKFDIRGAAEITDLADNVFIVGRNKPKELTVEKSNRGGIMNAAELELLDQPDTFLEVAKNRKTGEEKTFGLWFNKESNQFMTNSDRRPMLFNMDTDTKPARKKARLPAMIKKMSYEEAEK